MSPPPGLLPLALEHALLHALFARVGAFIHAHALCPAYARAALDAPTRDALWLRHWPALRRRQPAELCAGLCFVLACSRLGLEPAQGLAFADEARQPGRWLRLFLADHGLLPYDAPEPFGDDAAALRRAITAVAQSPSNQGCDVTSSSRSTGVTQQSAGSVIASHSAAGRVARSAATSSRVDRAAGVPGSSPADQWRATHAGCPIDSQNARQNFGSSAPRVT